MSGSIEVDVAREASQTRCENLRYCLFILVPTYVGLALAALPIQTKIPFAAYMPLSLAVVDDGEVAEAIRWKIGVGVVYLTIGVVAIFLRSVRLSLVVPLLLVASFPIFFLRFYHAMGAAFR